MSDRAANPWEGIEPHPDFRVLFVRHAESQINIMPELEIPRHALPPDSGVTYPLTKKGMAQAKAIGEQLAANDIIAIYTSTRTRCIQTATAIALPHGMPIQVDDDLVEIAFIDPAASMGMIEEDDVRAVMGKWQAGDIEAAAPGGGESLREVFQRFIPAVQKIIAQHAGQRRNARHRGPRRRAASPASRSSSRTSPRIRHRAHVRQHRYRHRSVRRRRARLHRLARRPA